MITPIRGVYRIIPDPQRIKEHYKLKKRRDPEETKSIEDKTKGGLIDLVI